MYIRKSGKARIIDTLKPAKYHFTVHAKLMKKLRAEIVAAHVSTLPSRYPSPSEPIACGTGPQILTIDGYRVFVPYGTQPSPHAARHLFNTLLNLLDRRDPIEFAHVAARPAERC